MLLGKIYSGTVFAFSGAEAEWICTLIMVTLRASVDEGEFCLCLSDLKLGVPIMGSSFTQGACPSRV